MNIEINNKFYKLYTEVIKGKNILAYFELGDILNSEEVEKSELIKVQASFLCTFLNNKFSVTQILKNVKHSEIDECSTVLFNYLQENIDHRLIEIFGVLNKEETIIKEKSIFDEYDKENGYEDLIVEDKKKLKDIIYSIYDYGTQNGNSFQDMNERINFVEYLDYFDFILNRKPKEEETDSNEE